MISKHLLVFAVVAMVVALSTARAWAGDFKIAIDQSNCADLDLVASQLLLDSRREIQDLREARQTLKELRELYEDGEISREEYERRQEKISALYLGEGMVEDNACATVACSFHGACVMEGEEPVCECDSDYEPAARDGLDCVPSLGRAKNAAIAGIVSAPIAAVLGGASTFAWAVPADGVSTTLSAVDAVFIATMGPVIGGNAHMVKRMTGAKGAPWALVTASVLYSVSVLGAGLELSLLRMGGNDFWPVPAIWSGVGASSLLLFSIDALVAYEQAIEARDGRPPAVPEEPRRVWTWIAFGVAGAAALGAIFPAILARNKREEVIEQCVDPEGGEEIFYCPESARGDYREMMTLGGLYVMLVDVAITGVVVGTALYFLEPRLSSHDAVSEVSVLPFAVPGGAGLAMGGRF